jgi:hypothetical protein
MSAGFQRTLQVALAVAISTGIAGNAQTDPAAAFEVISIKAHRPDDRQQRDPQFSPGYARFTSTGSALRHVIAFCLRCEQHSRPPHWRSRLDRLV